MSIHSNGDAVIRGKDLRKALRLMGVEMRELYSLMKPGNEEEDQENDLTEVFDEER